MSDGLFEFMGLPRWPSEPPPSNGTPTSAFAAERAAFKMRDDHEKILQALEAAGPDGFCDDEIRHLTGPDESDRVHPNAMRARRGELVKACLIEPSGVRRKSAGGNPAAGWIITHAGLELLRLAR
jgi:hypothetical protein